MVNKRTCPSDPCPSDPVPLTHACDNRDLNYDKFFTEGNEDMAKIEDYHSHNTGRLDVEGMKQLLLKLNFIREDLGLQTRQKGKEYRSE